VFWEKQEEHVDEGEPSQESATNKSTDPVSGKKRAVGSEHQGRGGKGRREPEEGKPDGLCQTTTKRKPAS